MRNIRSSEAEGVSFRSLVPQIQRTMAWSLWWSRCRLMVFDPKVLLPWSMEERMQASYTLPQILAERCLVVRTGKSFPNIPQATQHVAAMALTQPPLEYSMSPS